MALINVSPKQNAAASTIISGPFIFLYSSYGNAHLFHSEFKLTTSHREEKEAGGRELKGDVVFAAIEPLLI